ncbi:MAG: hypothetical protein ACFFD2_15925 [Promethearchaeota archaeon]
MSYKKPKLTDHKKLCPRCGAPMMLKSGSLKYCPVCHFSESIKKTELKIKIEEEEEEEIAAKTEIFQIVADDLKQVSSLSSVHTYIVVDRISNTLWIWKGASCSPGDIYKAGVQATKLKSSLKLYSANIKQVEEGEEPNNFPEIKKGLEIIEKGINKEEKEEWRRQEEERRRREEERRRREEERRRREEERRRQEEEKEEEERRRQEEEKEEEERRRQEEERKRQEEEKEEEERRRQEEERRRQEEERRRQEEEDKRANDEGTKKNEESTNTSEIWKKISDDTKKAGETKETGKYEINDEINLIISSLTLIKGVNEEIAKKLYSAEITSIMGLSLSNSRELAEKSGIELSVITELIENAKDLLGLD